MYNSLLIFDDLEKGGNFWCLIGNESFVVAHCVFTYKVSALENVLIKDKSLVINSCMHVSDKFPGKVSLCAQESHGCFKLLLIRKTFD